MGEFDTEREALARKLYEIECDWKRVYKVTETSLLGLVAESSQDAARELLAKLYRIGGLIQDAHRGRFMVANACGTALDAAENRHQPIEGTR